MTIAGSPIPIGLDGRMLSAATGIGQFARTVIAALRVVGIRPSILESGAPHSHRSQPAKLLAAARPWPRRAAVTAEGFFVRDIFREAQVFFDIHKRPMRVIVPGPAGVMHWSYPLPIRIEGWRNIYTVHDVLPLDPAIPSPVNGPRLRLLLDALRASDGDFATVSDAARTQIVDRMRWPAAAVVCCHQGVDVTGVGTGPLPRDLQRGGYLLYVGAIEARKNLHRLLDAYRASGLTTPLVISGPDGLGAATIDAQIATTPGAVRLGSQPRETVLQLIANARALILVSLAEGFGLPVAEAMALGTPVLAANVPALAEVTLGAALLTDPLDLAALRTAVTTIDGNASLRHHLSALGSQRAQHFSLAPYAHRLLSLYGMA